MPRLASKGRVAYEAYCRQTGGKSLVSGASLPDYDGLRPDIIEAWEKAAAAVLEAERHERADQ